MAIGRRRPAATIARDEPPARSNLRALLRRARTQPALLLGLAIAPTFAAGLVLLLREATYTLAISNGIAPRQLVTPEAFQGRVNATARMIARRGAAFGAAVGGVLAEATSIRATYAIMAAGVALSAAIGWWSPLRESGRLRHGTPACVAPRS